MRRYALLLPLVLAACSEAPPPAVTQTPPAQPAPVTPGPPPPEPQVAPMTPAAALPAEAAASFEGYGATRFGMTEAEVRAAHVGTPLEGDAAHDGCYILFSDQVDYMFDGGRFVRYSSADGAPAGPGGIRVNATREDVLRAFPAATEEPHKYIDGGKNLVVEQGDRKYVFETDAAGLVVKWRVGVVPAIDLVEDCG